jgi:hypothetical protein
MLYEEDISPEDSASQVTSKAESVASRQSKLNTMKAELIAEAADFDELDQLELEELALQQRKRRLELCRRLKVVDTERESLLKRDNELALINQKINKKRTLIRYNRMKI